METMAQTWQIFNRQYFDANPATAAPLVTVPNSDTFYYKARMLPYGDYAFLITVQMLSSFKNLVNYTSWQNGFLSIQEPMPELNLNGTNSLLWLPGVGNWTATLVYPDDWLANVTCSWTFGGSLIPVVAFIEVFSIT